VIRPRLESNWTLEIGPADHSVFLVPRLDGTGSSLNGRHCRQTHRLSSSVLIPASHEPARLRRFHVLSALSKRTEPGPSRPAPTFCWLPSTHHRLDLVGEDTPASHWSIRSSACVSKLRGRHVAGRYSANAHRSGPIRVLVRLCRVSSPGLS